MINRLSSRYHLSKSCRIRVITLLDTRTIKSFFLQSSFNEISVEKTFWFGKDRRFSIDKIAEFAGIDFLIEIIKKDNHFRSVISALNVLSFTDLSNRDFEIKDIFQGLIFSGEDIRKRHYGYSDQKVFIKMISNFLRKSRPIFMMISRQKYKLLHCVFLPEFFQPLKHLCFDVYYQLLYLHKNLY